MKTPFSFRTRRFLGFTLVEVMVSMALVIILMLILVQATDSVRRIWRQATSSAEQFREAREAFESMTRVISQATLNTYWDYDNPTVPTKYVRQSELRFISGTTDQKLAPTAKDPTRKRPGHGIFFQAPLGYAETAKYSDLQHLLNTWGYYVEWGNDGEFRPPFITDQLAPLRWRFRLMELMEPSENLTLYKYTSGQKPGPPDPITKVPTQVPINISYKTNEWFLTPLQNNSQRRTRPLAENILFLQAIPIKRTADRLTNLGFYDSGPSSAGNPAKDLAQDNQLPPLLLLTMLAVDETTFARNQAARGEAAPDWMDNLNGLFNSDNEAEANADQKKLETVLQSLNVQYRLFFTRIPIRGSKWSD